MKSTERTFSPDKSSGRKALELTEGRHKRLTDSSSNSAYDPRRLLNCGQRSLGQDSCGQVDQIRVAQVTGAQSEFRDFRIPNTSFSEVVMCSIKGTGDWFWLSGMGSRGWGRSSVDCLAKCLLRREAFSKSSFIMFPSAE